MSHAPFSKVVDLPTDPKRRDAIVTEIVYSLQDSKRLPYIVVDLCDGPTPETAVLHIFPDGIYPRWYYDARPRWWPAWFMPMSPRGLVQWLWLHVRWWFDPRRNARG